MNKHPSTPRLLHKIVDVCEILQLSRTMVYSMIRSGELKIVKFGQATRVPDAEVQKAIAKRAQVAA